LVSDVPHHTRMDIPRPDIKRKKLRRRRITFGVPVGVVVLAALYVMTSKPMMVSKPMMGMEVERVPAIPEKPWVSLDASGKLVYRTLPRGDRIIDFSYAGYKGGGVPLPKAPVVSTLAPSGTDDSAAIQQAIDKVSAQTTKDRKPRAIQLAPGIFLCSRTIHITASGVVLRGSGSSANNASSGTTLKLSGDPHVAIEIKGHLQIRPIGRPAHIVQSYVPAGARTITLDSASSFAPGDSIRITRMTTPAWLHFMGMDGMTRDGKDEVWVGKSISTIRKVVSSRGNVLTLDVPLTDSYDRAYLPPKGAEVVAISVTGRIEQDAVESLRIVAPAREVAFVAAFADRLFRAINLYDVRDAWLRDILIDETTAGIDVGVGSSRITIQDVGFHHTTGVTSPAKPSDFALRGSQTLVLRGTSVGDTLMFVITGPRNQGPNVVLDSVFHGNGHIQPHQRWSTGFLVDSTRVPGGGIDLKNRGEMGTGHGWTMGWGVVWNSSAESFVIQNPPGSANWSIGNSGLELTEPMKIIGQRRHDANSYLPQGFIQSPGLPVSPASLYRQQLSERLGVAAVKVLDQ
jgi:Pectate lyase superfamily protein